MRFSLLAVSAGLLLAACSTTGEGDSADMALAAGDPNRVICTREHVVGSNRPEKVCLTAQQRQALAQRSKEQLDELRNRVETAEQMPGT